METEAFVVVGEVPVKGFGVLGGHEDSFDGKFVWINWW